ncbi:sugar ABC transporter substrate-binding protein [candidate division WOR-3 bacterium]|nr:sugar ABC transporter substrate-binding protein [candidate division WOR-3 bacterium]
MFTGNSRLILYAVTLAGIFSLLVFGCTAKKEGVGKEQVSIACSYSPVDTGTQVIDKSIDKFMIEHPDIFVKKIWFTRDYQVKLMTMIAGGTAPDIFRVAPNMVPTYISRGIVMPLDDFIKKSSELKLKDFFPQVLHKYKFDGETIGKGPVYGFGTDWSPDYTLFFNKDMFDKEGIPHPTESLSWEEFRDIAKKLTHREIRKKQFGCLLSLRDIPLLVYQNGGRVFSEDGKKCLLDSPEAIEAFRFLVDLKVKDRVMPSYTETADTNQLQLFQMGKLGMFLSGRYYVPVVSGVVKNFKWGVAPGLHQKKRVNMVRGPCGWLMSKTVKHPDAAWKLMEWLVVGDCERELAKVGYNIPVIKKIAYSDLFLTNPNHPEGFNKIFMDEVEYTVPSPLTPHCPTDRWKRVISEELDLAYLEKQSPEEVAKKACKRINKLLKDGTR